MRISSRTPEGDPGQCPICGKDVCVEPSILFGDATCPNCGSLLWFLTLKGETRVFERSKANPIRDRVIQLVAEQLGVDPEKIAGDLRFQNELGADSLDLVELVMELEDEELDDESDTR